MSREKGIILLEALVALAIAGAGWLAVLRAQWLLHGESDAIRHRTEAVRLADNLIEQWRGFADAAGYEALARQQPGESVVIAADTRYTLHSSIGRSRSPDWLLADVSVTWTDSRGKTGTVSLRTALAGHDPALSGRLAWLPKP